MKKILVIGLIVGQVAVTVTNATSHTSLIQQQAPHDNPDDNIVWGT